MLLRMYFNGIIFWVAVSLIAPTLPTTFTFELARRFSCCQMYTRWRDLLDSWATECLCSRLTTYYLVVDICGFPTTEYVHVITQIKGWSAFHPYIRDSAMHKVISASKGKTLTRRDPDVYQNQKEKFGSKRTQTSTGNMTADNGMVPVVCSNSQ